MSEIELSGVETSEANGTENTAVTPPTEDVSQQQTETSAVNEAVAPPPVSETPVSVAEVVTATAPELSQNDEQLKEAVKGFLKVDLADFGDLVEKCSVQELTLLMEELVVIPLSRDNIRKVGKLKTRFDTLKEAHYKDIKTKSLDDPETKELKETVDATSKRFTAALAKFNQLKNEFETNEQKSREENTVKKRALLDKLMVIVQRDDFSAIEEVRTIQEEWKQTGAVIATETETIFQTYRTYVDQFYSQRQRYLDLLEQSRLVNLDQKRQLVKEAQNLIPEDLSTISRTFWQETSDKLKLLHEQWRTIGPVPKKDSDEVWEQFKQASDRFYEGKRAYFHELDEARAQNATGKREILNRLGEISVADYPTIDSWRDSTEEVKVLREKWKAIGPAPSSENDEINKSFTDKINHYFDRRTAFFDDLDKNNEEVLKRKEELLERAEALKDSEDWKKATDEMILLQKQWTEAGDDSFKDARKLRKRFRKACDTFFKRKKDHVSTIQQGEVENLRQKESYRDRIIEAVAKHNAGQTDDALTAEGLLELREQFESVGRVPLKNKDSIIKEFNKAFEDYLALLFPDAKERERFVLDHDSSAGNRGLPSSASPQRIEREEKQIFKRIQSVEEKITQFENNFFFISQSKSSDVFRKDIEAKIAEARGELERLKKKKDALKDLKRAERERQNAEKNPKPATSAVAEVTETPEVAEVVTETVITEAPEVIAETVAAEPVAEVVAEEVGGEA